MTWKPIPDFEGRYEASDDGRVRSFVWNHGQLSKRAHVLHPRLAPNGYPIVNLRFGGVSYTRAVHLWVARTFLGPCPAGMEVRHLDSNARNARLDNLKYGTRRENRNDARLANRDNSGERNGGAKLTLRKAAQVRFMKKMGMTGVAIARRMGISTSQVSGILHGRYWVSASEHRGFPIFTRLCSRSSSWWDVPLMNEVLNQKLLDPDLR